jgi:hypothetical protein
MLAHLFEKLCYRHFPGAGMRAVVMPCVWVGRAGVRSSVVVASVRVGNRRLFSMIMTGVRVNGRCFVSMIVPGMWVNCRRLFSVVATGVRICGLTEQSGVCNNCYETQGYGCSKG